ncbi:MAG: hypothetical protein E6K16_03955, partial [Methanobacteriota archaeon]
MVEFLDLIVRNLSLGTALIWFAVSLIPWLRGLRTAPERAFAAGSLLVGLWGLADWAFLHTSQDTTAIALLAVKARMTALVLASLAFLYFGRWLARSRGKADLLPLGMAAAVLAIIWTVAVKDVHYPAGDFPWLERDPIWFATYQISVGGLGFGTLYYLAWSLRHSSFASEASRKRLRAVLWVFALGLVVWVITNIVGNLAQGPGTPAGSAYPVILGIPLLIAVLRVDPQRFRMALRRLLVTPARPTMAVLYHNSGHPIAQIVLSGGKDLDAAPLGDLAGAVDAVLTKGLRSDPGALRQMRHGDYYIVFERGPHVTLVAVLKGPPSEGLRSEMRMAVRDFESIDGGKLD